MRKDRERSGFPAVEFLGEEPDPAAGVDDAALTRRVRGRALLAAGVLVTVLVVAAVSQDHRLPTAAPAPVTHVPRPSQTPLPVIPPIAPVELDFAGSPTIAISRAFATHIPGCIVISEHTRLTNRGRELDARKIRAVSGNVTLDIVVSRKVGLVPAHVTRIVHGVFAITIRSKGIYPPTHEQLRRLATDRRLTAVV